MEELYIDFKESEAYFLNGTANFTFNSSLAIDQYALPFTKSLSLVVVSCDRYYVVSQPLKKRISKQNAQFVILATYVLAACVALPIAFRTKFVEVLYEGQFVGICTEIWSSSQSKTVYTISLLLLHFIIPLMIMTVSNIHIVHILWTKKIPGEPDEKRDRRVAECENTGIHGDYIRSGMATHGSINPDRNHNYTVRGDDLMIFEDENMKS
ncbi:GPR10 [Mytilus edulis]|uniref:PRLHR n=1 Tax=Mytilus edulis TaxID=6550 RepID=A0A8S3QY28_MYTED|nr:GPR10 [Mytilus edulis]